MKNSMKTRTVPIISLCSRRVYSAFLSLRAIAKVVIARAKPVAISVFVLRQFRVLFRVCSAVLIISSVPISLYAWVKYSGNPILIHENVGARFPTTLKENNTYYLFYGELNVGDNAMWVNLATATAVTGPYGKYGTVHNINLQTWMSHAVYPGCVLKVATTYFMYYHGDDANLDPNRYIGVSTSTNLYNWSPHYNNPVLSTGLAGSPDSQMATNPSVIYKDSQFIMWYIGYNGSVNSVCRSTSTDGYNWEKYSGNPVLSPNGEEVNIEDVSVIFDTATAKYRMLYDKADNNIRYAESTDGINWVKKSNNPVLVGGPSAWDAQRSVMANFLKDATTGYVMWYWGYPNEDIGFANNPEPDAITNLSALTGQNFNEIKLSWTSPGANYDLDSLPSGSQYKIQYSSYSINWSTASANLTISTSAVSPGSLQSYTLTGLIGGATYYIRIWTGDETPSWSDLSNDATAQAKPDNTPPAGISNLTALKGANAGQIVLQWTSPGDDGTVGNLTGQFEIEYTTGGIITNANYYSPPPQMTSISISTSNLAPLTACTTTLYNLSPGATYYFAIKSKDDVNNISVWNSSADVSGVNTAAFLYIPFIAKSMFTGNWNVPGTWEGNAVPWANQGVEIKSGNTVTFSTTNASVTCSTLTILGTLQFDGAVANRSMVVAGNIDIQNGGQFLMPPNTGYISTLKIRCDTAGQYGIIVNNGGKFDVQGNTTTTPSTRNCLIASDNPSYKTYIRNLSLTEANFNMYYVEVSSVGVDATSKGGITFDGAGTRGKINYCSIHNGYIGIYLNSSSSNTISNNNCYSNTQYGIYFYNSSNNTISNNSIYANSYYGIYFYNSSNNTISNNSCYSNSQNGIYIDSSSNNTLNNNSCYSNTLYGIYFVGSSNNIMSNNNCYSNAQSGIVSGNNSINNTAVKCELSNNTNSDIQYINGSVSKLTLKNCNLYSSTKVNTTGINTAGSYLVSYNQDGTQGTTKIWGDYHIGTGQALSLQKFNYAEPLYVSTATLPNSTLSGTGSITYPTTISSQTLTEFWEVKFNGSSFDVRRGTWSVLTNDGTASAAGVPYTSTTRGVSFAANGTFILNDAFYFVTISSSADMNVQKKLEFSDSPIGTKLTVDNGGTIQMLGTSANPTISTNAVGSTYYGFQSSGTLNLSNYDIFNLKSSGLEIYPNANVVDLSTGTFDNSQGGAGSSCINVNGITSNKTFYGCKFNAPADYNVKADGAGINWTFLNWSGVRAGENYDYETNGAQIKWDATPPTITDLQGGDDVVRNAGGTAYNVDFNDNDKLDTIQYRVTTLPSISGGGTEIIPWTNIAVNIGASSYTTDWQVNFAALQSLPTTNYVSVRVWDVAGNTTTVNDVFYVMKDTVPPTSGVSSPVDAINVQTLTTISGTCADNYSVGNVNIQIKRFSDGQYWDGVSKVWTTVMWNAASSTYPSWWTYTPLTDAYLTPGTSYQIRTFAVDTLNNNETPGAGITFTYKTKKTISSGNWTDAATWSGGQQPLDGDAVFLKPSWAVTLNANTSNLYSLTIEDGAKLGNTSYQINISSFDGGGIYNYGTLDYNTSGALNMKGNKVVVSTATSQQICNDFYVLTGATITLQSDITVGGIRIENGGKLDSASKQITLKTGSWNMLSGGTFLAGSSTVTFAGGTGSPQDINFLSNLPQNFANLRINNGFSVVPYGALDINGDFTIQSGTFVAGNFEHFISSNFTQTGGGFEANTSTITFDGSGLRTISVLAGTSFYCLKNTGITGSTLRPLSNLDINGDFTHAGTGSFDFGNYTYNFAGKVSVLSGASYGGSSKWIYDGITQQIGHTSGDIIIVKNPAVLKFTATPLLRSINIDPGCSVDATGLNLQLRESFTSSGTFINSGSTVTFETYSGNGSIWTVASSTFNNVTIQKPSITDIVTALTSLNIGGWLKVNSGTLNMGSTIHTIQGNTTISGIQSRLDIGSSTTTLVGAVNVLNGGTLLLPNATPNPVLKLGVPGANYLNVDSGGFFISQSSNNLITSTNPGGTRYTFKCYASTLNITGATFESPCWEDDALFISSDTKIVNLNNVNFKSLVSTSRAITLGYTTIPGTFTFTGHQFDSTVNTNVNAPNLTSGIVVMQDATGAKAGAAYEWDNNDRVFWQPGDSISVVKPAGGEIYVVGTSTPILWNTNGSIKNVRLEYSKDDFATAGIFIANVSTSASFGSYNWTIPNDVSATVKVRVSALNYSAIYSNSTSNFTIQQPVAAPSNLKVSLLGTTSIQWQFTDNATNETGLYISSGANVSMRLSNNLGPLTGTGLTTSWFEINLSTNTQYTRYAEAVNAGGSSWSAVISSYTAAAVPKGTKIIARSSYSVELDWQPNGNPEPGTGYDVWSSSVSDFYNYTAVGASTTSYVVANLLANTTYYFRVHAMNEDLVQTDDDITISTQTLKAQASKLVVVAPGETFTDGVGKAGAPTSQTAGVSFTITVNAVGITNWIDPTANQITTVTTTDNYDTEPINRQLQNGTTTFDITLVTAKVSSVTASATGITAGSSYLNVVAGLPSKLQVLVPGETVVSGSATGKTGTPNNQQSGAAFNITVNVVDSYWNLVTSTQPTVKIVTSDPVDTEPINRQLQNGTTTFMVTLITLGNTTITASDVSSTLTQDISPSITVNTESTPPTVAIIEPANNSYKNSLTSISGTAADNVSVSSVTIRISDGSQDWDGVSAWTVPSIWLGATLYPSSWTYTSVPSWVSGSSYTVIAKSKDSSDNWSTAYSTNTFTYDTTAPTSAVVNPADGSTISSLGTISGTATDNVGLNKVEVAFMRLSDNQYWTGGAGWSVETWLSATGTNPWQYTGITNGDLTDNTSYQIISKATDLANNVETPGARIKFTYLQPPNAPTAFTISDRGTNYLYWGWFDNSTNESGFRLRNSTGGLVAELSVNTTYYLESGLSVNTSYYRYVESYNANGSSASTAATYYTSANPPSGTSVVSVSSVVISLTWSSNSNPAWTDFFVQRATSSDFGNIVEDGGTNVLSYNWTSLSPNTEYYFRVRARNGDGIPTNFDVTIQTVTLPAPVSAPDAPTGLAATEVTNSSIKWVWTDVANEQGYYLQTSTGGFVSSLSADVVSYSETGLTPNTQYSRYLEAYNAGGISTSTVVSKYTLASTPTSFLCSSKDFNWISLSWSANSNSPATIYELYRSTDNASFGLINQATTTVHLDTGLAQLTTYYYRLYSVNAESIKTGPAELTVQTLNSVIKGPISGKVTQANGTVAFPVLVQLFNNDGTIKIAETFNKSDDGSYLFENLDDGIYQVKCSWLVNEIESVVYKTDIPENSKDVLFTLEIKYDVAFLSGKITLGSKANFVTGRFAPAQQPFVELLQRGRVIAKIDADTSGNYTIPNLLPGKYVVRAFNGVQMSEPSEIKVAEGEKIMLNFRWALGLQDSEVYAYPNPCKDSVTVRYKANTNHTATLRIYNIASELVKTIKGDGSDFRKGSNYKIPWNLENDDGSEVASGIYIYILELKETGDDGEKATVKKKIAVIK
ncbi:MAG: right-handed parallel beta-helix repeat-containing protein [Elusimicrobia bacterium]|nr:right-handed parallel beta-helix repeat-containing protein [Elusimicrobiota bacterium]